VELKNPGAIKLQSSHPAPILWLYGISQLVPTNKSQN